MVSKFTYPDVNTWEVGRTLDKLETTPLRVVVSYTYLVFSQLLCVYIRLCKHGNHFTFLHYKITMLCWTE